MDGRIEANLEDHLRGALDVRRKAEFERALAEADPDTRHMIERFEEHARLLRESFRSPEGLEPRPGFYGRVMERIEAQRKGSLWMALLEPVFFRRLALASAALLLMLGLTMFTSAPQENFAGIEIPMAPEQVMAVESEPLSVMSASNAEEGRNVVLVDLTTHRE